LHISYGVNFSLKQTWKDEGNLSKENHNDVVFLAMRKADEVRPPLPIRTVKIRDGSSVLPGGEFA